MLVKLAVLGTLGYVGYRYLQKTQVGQTGIDYRSGAPRQIALAGGPLSDQARVQSDPDSPPAGISPASASGTPHAGAGV